MYIYILTQGVGLRVSGFGNEKTPPIRSYIKPRSLDLDPTVVTFVRAFMEPSKEPVLNPAGVADSSGI